MDKVRFEIVILGTCGLMFSKRRVWRSVVCIVERGTIIIRYINFNFQVCVGGGRLHFQYTHVLGDDSRLGILKPQLVCLVPQ